MKSQVRTNLIKMLTIAVVVCLGIFVALIPMQKTPASAEEIAFTITGDDLNGAQTGLKFVGSLSGTPDEYGILVYPASNGSVDTAKTVAENDETLDALNFINNSTATITFNRDTMLAWEGGKVTEDNVDAILDNFYGKDFTATPYFVVEGVTTYGESYTSNLDAVATAHLDSDDAAEQKCAQKILGYISIDNAVLEGNVDLATIDGLDGYTYPAAIYANGTLLYEVDEPMDSEAPFSTYINAFNVNSNVVDIRVVAEHTELTDESGNYLRQVICFNDATYWTSIISDVTELTTALSYTGVNSANNYGFYKMDADITLTENLALTYYSGTVSRSTGKGFVGQFDGDGHYIDFAGFKTSTAGSQGAAKPAGLFGDFAYAYSGKAELAEQPKAQTTVKNLAVLNFPSTNNDYVFARYTMEHGYSTAGTPYFENIYVTYKGSGYTGGALIRYPGAIKMKNVVVDATSHSKNAYSTNAAYNGGVSGTTFFNSVSKLIPHNNNYNGGTLFQSLTSFQPSKSSFENVISIGRTPLAWQNEHTWWDSQRGPVKSVANEDGTYTHSIDLTKGYSGDYGQFIAYAGNQTVGDVAVKLSIKEKFLKLEGVSANAGHNLAGAYCATCYDEFSLVTDGTATCPTCNVAMTVVTSSTGSDMWAIPAIYNWGVEDTSNLVFNASGIATGGSVKLEGTAKYNTIDLLTSKFLNDTTTYDAYLGEEGNGMWAVNEKGELTWGALVSDSYIFNEIDFDASTGELISTDLPAYEDIQSITVGENVLTKDNGGIIATETGWKLNVLAADSTDTNGVPFMNTKLNSSNMLTVSITTANGTSNYANVRYQTMIISDVTELTAALNGDVASGVNNYGFYTMDADIKLESAITLTNVYSDTNQNGGKGFVGQFDGAGHSIDFVKTGIAGGMFGNFAYKFSNDSTLAEQPKAQTTVKNLAILNYKGNAGPVLAKYSTNHGYSAAGTPLVENVYVKMTTGDLTRGLIQYPGTVFMSNVYVDAKGSANDTYNVGAAYGDIAGKAFYAASDWYKGGSLFVSLTNFNQTSTFDNVISIGKNALAWQPVHSHWRKYAVKHTLLEEGTYTHEVELTPFSQDYAEYIAYASNQTVGDVAMRVSVKDNFLALVTDNDGSAPLAGAYCATCYNQFSLTSDGTATCPHCEGNPVMTTVVATDGKDMWCQPAIYNWGLADLTNYSNPTSIKNGGYLKLAGTSKYNSTADMATAYGTDATIYDSFTGDAGNGLWSVVDGVLTWVGAQA